MSKLSPTQERILKAAAKKQELDIREHMADIKSPAIKDKVVESMLKNGLIAEGDQDGGLVYLISDAGLDAIGARRKKKPETPTEEAETAPQEKASAETEKPARKVKAPKEPGEPKVTKQQIIIDMLKREEGATLKQMMEATGWQRHSLHGAMAGGLKKKLGLTIDSTKEVSGERVYKIA